MSSTIPCLDNPKLILEAKACVASVSKDLHGEIVITAEHPFVCEKRHCETLNTIGDIKAALKSDQVCDSKLGIELDGSFTVGDFATIYDTDGMHRGVHAGDFTWNSKAGQIRGRMSGITNAGILRAAPFADNCEKCSTPGIMIGRLCGEVVEAADPAAKAAQLVAVYRFQCRQQTPKGGQGSLIGTIEGALILPC
jgi:hypothetical protein